MHLHREGITASLIEVDPLAAFVTLRLRGRDHRIPFRRPGSDWTGPLSPTRRTLRHLRKYLGRVVDVEVTYHNESGWTIFGRRAITIR